MENMQYDKQRDLSINKSNAITKPLTTNQGVKINDDNNSLKSGDRGPTLLEDFILRDKITHFDHKRIPERIVHARGSGAHAFFEVTNPIPELTKAGFLQKKGFKTPVFARFRTVAGSRGSTDLARDMRGFSVKFYTQEGIYDLVGNNIPVFFIQDASKFPDIVHAVKPESYNEIPQPSSAHDTFWDFISLMPESMHIIMWLMSDRDIPRSLRMMEGFGVHIFRFINESNESTFVKFHWKPKLGTHAVTWDEAQKISGKNLDFHREDLWESIEMGNFSEWELGVQIIPNEDEHKFNFDLLDPTKLVPEELVPVTIIGRMVLNKNPDNFFAETEQIAFHPGHAQDVQNSEISNALSMLKNPANSLTIASRKVAIICTNRVSGSSITSIKNVLIKEDAKGFIIAPHLGTISTDDDGSLKVDFSFLTTSSVLSYAVFIPHGFDIKALFESDDVSEFLNDAYKHCKVAGAEGEGSHVISAAPFASKIVSGDQVIITTTNIANAQFAKQFILAMSNHRFWNREPKLYI